MTGCPVQASGSVELYFYGELAAIERAQVEQHIFGCSECRNALEELRVIRAALARRPDVSAPPDGDWSRFMARLDEAVRHESGGVGLASNAATAPAPARSRLSPLLAMAALLALVTTSVAYVARSRQTAPDVAVPAVASKVEPAGMVPVADPLSPDAAFAALSEQHFERSKLVILGLAHKDPQREATDWTYERQLASSLLSDTRLYRLAAEERGMASLARTMGDLELVLLQTSLSADPDPATLQQIQRLIRKRDLVAKINTAAGM